MNRLYEQIAALGDYQVKQIGTLATATGKAVEQAQDAAENGDSFRSKMQAVDASGVSWLVAVPTDEAPFEHHEAPEVPSSYVVLSADGSQIEPNRHGPTHAFLINIGTVRIGYGEYLGYALDSAPRLFFEEKEIMLPFGGEERPVSGSMLPALRQKMEFEALGSMIKACDKYPSVALIDGTMILWNLEANPERLRGLADTDLKKQSFTSFLDLVEAAKHGDVPVAGYISSPGSSDVVNALKAYMCPTTPGPCKGKIKDCSLGAALDGDPACAKIDGVTDAVLFGRLLAPCQRSSLFRSRSEILDAYRQHGEDVFFFYVNAGKEIARVEVPRWVAESGAMVDLLHAVCLDQAEKGLGYPIAVAEAHEQAVVKAADKNIFDDLVLRALIKRGAPIVHSRKAVRKKGGFI